MDDVNPPDQEPPPRSAWQVISEASGQRLFKSAKEVDDYIAEERASWNMDAPNREPTDV